MKGTRKKKQRSESELYGRQIVFLLIFSMLVRVLIAGGTEFGNDEGYYRIFGLFPSLSYFDHAPMVAWLVNLTTRLSEFFTDNDPFTLEFYVRLSSVIIGTINTYIIYRIAGRGERGFMAALLLTGSIYASIIVGTFIMPDTPLSLFWLLTLWIFFKILPPQPQTDSAEQDYSQRTLDKKMLLAGLTIGLAMLSKYSGAYLWAAALLYIVLYNRKWLHCRSLYVAMGVSLLVFSPVLIWNFQNDFISFTFHSGRLVADSSINLLYFGREIFGGFFYNNPINYILIICAIFAYIKYKNNYIDKDKFRYLLVFSLPLILLFIFISLTRETLPHWSGPGYFALIILAAYWLKTHKKGLFYAWCSVAFTLLISVIGVVQINKGIVQELGIILRLEDAPLVEPTNQDRELGRGDVTVDMYGWRQLCSKFSTVYYDDLSGGLIGENPVLISHRWDEAAHLDIYVAEPNELKLVTVGDLYSTHFYEAITQSRGGFDRNNLPDGAYLVVSSKYFDKNIPAFKILNIDPEKIDHTITIVRMHKCVVNFFLYRIAPTTSTINRDRML